MEKEKIIELVKQMTLEEKASLCSGADFWHTEAIERLGIPNIMVSDGPHGLRTQVQDPDNDNVNNSIVAVCYPTGSALAASFDRALAYEVGEAIGEACQAEGVGTILGPAINIKRSPLCGRNFEYYSEDPYQAGEMATSFVKGVQSKHVGTSVKHFAANNQETRRLSSDSVIDERTLHEIYLPAFEKVVKEAQPWTIMCSYNRLNGEYTSENKHLLTEILRDDWGFDGVVMSDWGAVSNRVKGVEAGMDLEMPSSFGINDEAIVEAVKNGALKEAYVDQTVIRILEWVYKYREHMDASATFDRDKQHELSRKAAEKSIVLLKNEDAILPLTKEQKIAVIGSFAKVPRYQGGGSSHINSYKVPSFMDSVKDVENVSFAKGYHLDKDIDDVKLIEEAVTLAKNNEIALIFAGLPDDKESEGFDRDDMELPACQNHLIKAVSEVNKNVIVVLHNGSPVEMPWVDDVKGIVEAYLGGEAIGEAVYNVLFGNVNPSGKLAETFPVKMEDNPSHLFYIGEGDTVEYREGIFVGYRYYDKKKMDVLFPFGHGLSYTSFAYSNMRISDISITDKECVEVEIDVTNTGDVYGQEVVQLYVTQKFSSVIRPEKELKGFEKVSLDPGETKTVHFTLDKHAFGYYDIEHHDIYVESDTYEIKIGSSSRNILATEWVDVENTNYIPKPYTMDTTMGDIRNNSYDRDIVDELIKHSTIVEASTIESALTSDDILALWDEDNTISQDDLIEMGEKQTMADAMLEYMPLRSLLTFQDGTITRKMVEDALDKINQKRK